MIAVTGASGEVGRRVAARLAERGAALRLVVRDRSRAPDIPGAEVRQASSYGAGEEMRAALEGADTVFMIPAGESEDRVQQHLTTVDAAAAAGLGRIVYLSFVNASAEATFTFVRHHWATEQRVLELGLPHTFLRMSLFLDYIPFFASPAGVIAGPADDGRVAPVARDDIADSAAAVLTDDGHDGRTYDLTGPRAFTLSEAAEEMSRFSGKRIAFHDETVEEAYAARASYGAPDWEVEGWVTTYLAIAAGEVERVSDHVERLAGHPPVTLGEFLAANPHALDHVE